MVFLTPSLHEHNYYPPLMERIERALGRLGLDSKGFHVVICPDADNLADLMVKQFTQDRLAIEVKKTREDVSATRTWKQARGYVTNSTTAGLRHFCVTNGELLYIFRHEEGLRVAACLVAGGRKDLGNFGPAGEADEVLDRWEAAVTDLLRDLFVSQHEYALDRSFAGLIEKYQQAHILLAGRLRHSVAARLAGPEWRDQFLAWCRTFSSAPEDPENHAIAAEEAAHLLLHRILCYELFRTQLDLLEESLKKRFRVPKVALAPLTASAVGDAPITEILAERFQALTRVNYAQVFARDDVLDSLPLDAEAEGIVRTFLEDVEAFPFDVGSFEEARREFSTVFEQLVPQEKRQRYGQVFTPRPLVDLLAHLCITEPDQRVLDPAAGSGAFLDGAYDRLGVLALAAGRTLSHPELLDHLYGVEIGTFPLHLSAVRLALKHPALPTDAHLAHANFFRVTPAEVLAGGPVDVVLGNPPYIRQEAIEDKEAIRTRICQAFEALRAGPAEGTAEQPADRRSAAPGVLANAEGAHSSLPGLGAPELGAGLPTAPAGTQPPEFGAGLPTAPAGTHAPEFGAGLPTAPAGTAPPELGAGRPAPPAGTPPPELGAGLPTAPAGTQPPRSERPLTDATTPSEGGRHSGVRRRHAGPEHPISYRVAPLFSMLAEDAPPAGRSYPYSPREADLYFYFVEYATAFLREGGAAGWVLSDKFLVVDAGRHLKQFILDHYHVRAVIILGRRAFPEALVDNCVLVLRRQTGGADPEAPTLFLKVRRPLTPDAVAGLLAAPRDSANAYRRVVVRRRREIHAGEKWTSYLSDASVARQVLSSLGMVPLLAVASYERGPDNGCGAFFFPSREMQEDFGIPERFLTPAVERANDLQGLVLRRSQCKQLLRVPPDTSLEARENAALRTFVDYASAPDFDAGYRHKGHYVPVPERPVVVANAGGGPWWSFLRGTGEWHILVPRGFRTHYKVVVNRARAHISTNFWGLRLRGAGRRGRELVLDIAFVGAFLNSALGQVQVEREARRYAGFTKLERQELERLRILDPQVVPLAERQRIYHLFLALDAAYGTADFAGAREALDRAFLELLGCPDRYDDLADLLEELVAERHEAGESGSD